MNLSEVTSTVTLIFENIKIVSVLFSTQVTIVIKYFFQFGFFPFNKNVEVDKVKPFHPPNIIGVEKKEGYVHYDLFQLLALFFHRSILKVLTCDTFDVWYIILIYL